MTSAAVVGILPEAQALAKGKDLLHAVPDRTRLPRPGGAALVEAGAVGEERLRLWRAYFRRQVA